MPKTAQTPGTMLKALLEKSDISVSALAKEIQTSNASMFYIIGDKVRITLPIALRLAKFFGTADDYWLKVQMEYDLEQASKDKELQKVLKGIQKYDKKKAAEKKSKPGKSGSTEPKKRGRKPKAEAPLKTPSKRGQKSKAALTEAAAKVPQKRGRKPKETSAASSSKTASPAPARKRGRKPKEAAGSASAVSEHDSSPQPVRKRGRKPKGQESLPVETAVEEKRELHHILIKQDGTVIDSHNLVVPDSDPGEHEPELS